MVETVYRNRKAKIVWANKQAGSAPSAKAVAEVQFLAMQKKPVPAEATPEKLSAHSVRLEKPEMIRTRHLDGLPSNVASQMSHRHRQASGLNAL